MATKLLTGKPVEPPDGSVIKFYMYTDGYLHAAVRVGNDWFVTQASRSIPALSWDSLLARVGIDNWETMELMA